MTETVTITGNLHGNDALEFALYEETRTVEQDLDVVAHCPRVLESIVELCARFDQTGIVLPRYAESLGPGGEQKQNLTATPPVRYVSTQTGAEGAVQLITQRWPAMYKMREDAYTSTLWLIIPDPKDTELNLDDDARSPIYPTRRIERKIHNINKEDFFTYGVEKFSAGTLGELNQFNGLVDKMRTALFPKQK